MRVILKEKIVNKILFAQQHPTLSPWLVADEILCSLEENGVIIPPPCSESGFKYYYYDERERNRTGLTIDEIVKYFENDLLIIVVDLTSNTMYRAGKPIEVVNNAKNAKTIEFKALK